VGRGLTRRRRLAQVCLYRSSSYLTNGGYDVQQQIVV
jgi:hypothetical protein